MTDRAAVDEWVRRYVHAWGTNDPREIGELFTDEAEYFTAPHREPWRGREAIVAGWLDRRDPPDTWTFEHEVVGVDGDTGFVRGTRSERIYREVKVMMIGGGSEEIMKDLAARQLGL